MMIYGYLIIIFGLFFICFVDWRYVFGWMDNNVETDEDLYESMDVNYP